MGMKSTPIWGAVFDWDGVIIDSSRQHEKSWEMLAAEEKRPLPANHFKQSFGMKNEKIIPELLQWATDPIEIKRLSLRKEELYREIVRAGGIGPLPGVIQWLDSLWAGSIPCVIASSTHRENISCTLGVLGLEKYFKAIVSAEDVTHGKPDPEVFLLAARKIGVPPEHCVVFEDAHVGIEAARAARMRVVGVATTHPAESLQDADRVVKRLDELTVHGLNAWWTPSAPRLDR
jgi:beta-phosphoglucomutase family hydrolase